jgi:alanine dehydrogenase
MKIGIPKEIKPQEYRVGLTPESVAALVVDGHEVYVEHDAAVGIGVEDEAYLAVGAKILKTAVEIFNIADMIVKVKEPQENECEMLRSGQILFSFLHLAPNPLQTERLRNSGCSAIAYETVTAADGSLPLLTPMSEIAGRLALQNGGVYLQKNHGGLGLLLGGVAGAKSANVVVIGGGAVGEQALKMAIGMEARVSVLDISNARLQELKVKYGEKLNTVESTPETIMQYVIQADLVIGAVLIPGASSPHLITRDIVSKMKKGGVLVDVAIDQGGVSETSRATTYDAPTFLEEGVIHFCVANLPSAVPLTSTYALNRVTYPFVSAIANKGFVRALKEDSHLKNGLNVFNGNITCKRVAEELGLDYHQPDVFFDTTN